MSNEENTDKTQNIETKIKLPIKLKLTGLLDTTGKTISEFDEITITPSYDDLIVNETKIIDTDIEYIKKTEYIIVTVTSEECYFKINMQHNGLINEMRRNLARILLTDEGIKIQIYSGPYREKEILFEII